jgi:hypothetical protein
MRKSESGKPMRASASRENKPIRGVSRSQQHRHERTLPIVTVDHVGHPELLGKLDGGARELCKALGIIRIIAPAYAIKLFAIEILRIIDEEILHAARPRSVCDTRKTQGRAHRNRQALDDNILDLRISITRQNHSHVVSLRNQRFRKRLHHIGQAAGFGERQTFGSDE